MTTTRDDPSGVTCTSISYRYGSRVALDDVSLRALPGTVTGLIGPNGAGKTTLIRLLSTVLPLQIGDFRVAGYDSQSPSEIKQRIGVLPESAGYPLSTSGLEYLRYFARLYGLGRSEAAERAGRLLNEMGLGPYGSDRIKTYSRGMRQRLGLARCLINDPKVLFLDEPTLGLDPAGQREVLEIVEEAARRREATVILTSHLLDEVEQICDLLVVLDKGRVVGSGRVSDLAPSGSLREVFLRLTGNE